MSRLHLDKMQHRKVWMDIPFYLSSETSEKAFQQGRLVGSGLNECKMLEGHWDNLGSNGGLEGRSFLFDLGKFRRSASTDFPRKLVMGFDIG